jgi:isopenicillin-N N-acyltransferase-like protein
VLIKIFCVAVLCLLWPLAASPPAQACTLFAAAGSRVEGGGTLIAKNRDRSPRRSALRLITPRHGYRHLALVDADSTSQDFAVAGINEKGLVAVDALPSSLAADQPDGNGIALTQALLTQCASVDEVLARRDLLAAAGPVFEMVADRRQVAVIEVAPRGQVAVMVNHQGVLCHTNHYLDQKLQWANQQACDSSRIRHRRLGQLLARQQVPFDLEDFLAFSRDRHDGPDNSIWRSGGTPTETRTLATWLVAQLPGEAPRVYIRIANPGEPQKIVELRLGPYWWARRWQEKVL